MIRKVMIGLCIVFLQTVPVYTQDIKTLRSLYEKALGHPEYCERLLQEMHRSVEVEDVVRRGYQGVYFLIKSRFLKNPVKRMRYFKKGRIILDSAIQEAPENIELRLLRYNIQKKAPKFLKYFKNEVEDKAYIMDYLDRNKRGEEAVFIRTHFSRLSS